MTINIHKQRIIFLIIPIFLGFFLITMGILGILFGEETLDRLLGGFLIIPGVFILLHSITEAKNRHERRLIIKHDERSIINRLKAADLAFRFLFITLALLIVLNALKIINEIIFVAITGPIVALGVLCYNISFYWFERRG
ncbi:hypothetical protein [Candidatus Hodarchaeum mangrovi]